MSEIYGKCGICLTNKAEADGCCTECKGASEPALLSWQNQEDGQTIARLNTELIAIKTQLEDTIKIIRKLDSAMDMQEKRETEVFHIPQKTAWYIWNNARKEASKYLKEKDNKIDSSN